MRHVDLLGAAGAVFGVAALLATAADARVTDNPLANFTDGATHLRSAGPLAFGPVGILFVGDSTGGQIVAIDTHDRNVASAARVNVMDINGKIGAMVGVSPDQLVINDLKVNPISKNVYLSVERGRGPTAMPLIVKVSANGSISVLSLDVASHSSVSLTDAPAPPAPSQGPAGFGRPSARSMTITDMAFVNGNLMVAGLSNEEWNSALRSIPFPFQSTAGEGATIQIWHASHGRYETQAPIRTFLPYAIGGQQFVLAAYTCTPLVKIPFGDLQAGAKVHGTTIADLGMGNQPLDMVPYTQNGHNYILINNTSRGVMKLDADNLGSYQPIDSPTKTDIAGVPYRTIDNLHDVVHMAKLGTTGVLILTGTSPDAAQALGPMDLRTITLP